MKNVIFGEITPLSSKDCIIIFSRLKNVFTYPIHTHENIYELNFIENAKGAKRIVGDSIEEIGYYELVLVTSSHLGHSWFGNKRKYKDIKEITIQFHSNLLDENLLGRNQFRSVKEMFEKAQYGVTFSEATIERFKDSIVSLSKQNNGAHTVLAFIGLLYDLSLCNDMRMLSSKSFLNEDSESYDSRRINKAYHFMLENYEKQIKLENVAAVVNMSATAFSRFIKKRTGKSYVDAINDIRLGHATRMLVETTHSIIEICYLCGFNNLSNFNRIFKKKKNCTPREFRDNYWKTHIII
jgi:AraC-like DNA-binding protein